ncbi:MAG: hypothetical protein ACJ8AS_07010 [Hyphomicrobiales bacterium]
MILDPVLDLFRGKAVTIPPMDGALRPNTALDECENVVDVEAPDNLCFDGEHVLFSCGSDVFGLSRSETVPLGNHELPVAAMAAGPGRRAIALENGTIVIEHGSRTQMIPAPNGYSCPTAVAFADAATLFVCHGSSRHDARDWVIDLMEKNATGALWKIELDTGRQTKVAGGLAFPYGVLARPDGVVVSEAWKHRLVLVSRDGRVQPVLTKLPAYPARLAPASDGGAWLALFAPRNRLIEFILREEEYRRAMMREVPREHWIAPALASGATFLEPLQCGGVKTMGIHKPWSPSRSYGLLARLDRELQPIESFHSRADGKRHGVTSMVEADECLYVSAKGGGAVLRLSTGS